jgi:hypothetical protein
VSLQSQPLSPSIFQFCFFLLDYLLFAIVSRLFLIARAAYISMGRNALRKANKEISKRARKRKRTSSEDNQSNSRPPGKKAKQTPNRSSKLAKEKPKKRAVPRAWPTPDLLRSANEKAFAMATQEGFSNTIQILKQQKVPHHATTIISQASLPSRHALD